MYIQHSNPVPSSSQESYHRHQRAQDMPNHIQTPHLCADVCILLLKTRTVQCLFKAQKRSHYHSVL